MFGGGFKITWTREEGGVSTWGHTENKMSNVLKSVEIICW